MRERGVGVRERGGCERDGSVSEREVGVRERSGVPSRFGAVETWSSPDFELSRLGALTVRLRKKQHLVYEECIAAEFYWGFRAEK